MEVKGPNMGGYQPQHIQVVQRETPQTVKPNVFKEADETAVSWERLIADAVNLSDEARELLKGLRKKGLSKEEAEALIKKFEKEKLIYTLKDLRDQVEAHERDQEDNARRKSRGKYVLPSTIQLTGPQGDSGSRPRQTAAGQLIERMVVYSPHREATLMVVQDLEVLGEKMIDTVRRFHVHIIIMSRKEKMGDIKIKGMYLVGRGEKTFDGRDWNLVRGLYDHGRRLMVVGEETVGRRSHSAPRHEFAHAYDHTFTDNNQRRMPLSVQLWNLFAERRKGLVTSYAGTNPAEYFAESVEAYFHQGMKDVLRNCDPQMYEYLDNLFAA